MMFSPACMLLAVTGMFVPAQNDGASPPQGSPAPVDLVAIAKAEAVRERAAIESKVGEIVVDLRKSSDDTLGFIQTRIDELAKLGAPAVRAMIAVMDHGDADPGSVNAGVNAAKALARSGVPGLVEQLRTLGANGKRYGRRNAVLALGLCGDASLVPFLTERLADAEGEVVREAVVALGRVGADRAEPLLVPFLQSADASLVAATITALAETDAKSSAADVVARIQKELGATPPNEALVRAGVAFLEKRPSPAGIGPLEQVLLAGNTDVGLRSQAVAGLMATARKDSGSRKDVLRVLRDSIKLLPRGPMREAAKGMNELGDDSGVKIVTEDLDRQIEKSGSNVSARYKRADLLLEFGKWKEANRDLKEALKVDRDPADPEWLNLALARSFAGMGRYSDASKHVAKLERTDVTQLPNLYAEFLPMLNDSRYEKAFAAPAGK